MNSLAGTSEQLAAPVGTPVHGTPVVGVASYRMPAKVMHWISAVLVIGMVASGVIAKQIAEGPVADTMFSLHKLVGAITLGLIVVRLLYRLLCALPNRGATPHQRRFLHWTLYAVVILVPLLGWAGISDFGAREIFPGFSLPAIWPEGWGYDEILLEYHAYFAFVLLALVALHIGVAVHDYMTDEYADVPQPK